MQKYILALNCGSSSLKFNLFLLMEQNRINPVIEGVVEEIGNIQRSRLKLKIDGQKSVINKAIQNHKEALSFVFDEFEKTGITKTAICAVGHRVVHGGDKYNKSVRIDANVIKTIEDLIPIAPLHNPPNLTGIEETIKLLPEIPQVAVFDTAFHSSIPEYAFRYAVPEQWYREYGVRTYGFHGTSHMYVSRRTAKILDIPYNQFNAITAHLGNGCSISKIQNGKSTDTSMGFTPLEGLIMGTRSGDIDPALISHVAECISKSSGIDKGTAYDKVMHALNKESGLKALAGTNMMQDIREKALSDDIEAELVISIYAYRIAKYIGAYWATMPYTNAIIFTAGLGENEGYVREKVLKFLSPLNFEQNNENNAIRGKEILIATSSINPTKLLSVMVIPTDEESIIGYDALYLGYLNEDTPDTYPFEMD